MHGECSPAPGSTRGDPGPDARLKFSPGPQARGASPGPARSPGALGAATCLPHAGRGHPEPRTALRQDLGGCYRAGDTALHSLCRDRWDNPPAGLPAPCSALRPARPRATLPAPGSWGSLSPETRCSPSHIPPNWDLRSSRLAPRSWGFRSGWNRGAPAMILPDAPHPAPGSEDGLSSCQTSPPTYYTAHLGP